MNIHRLYFSLVPQFGVITPRAHGLDISKYDLYFLPKDAINQLDFVIQRVSYGYTRDELFDKLIGGVMQVGIRGRYHYLSSGLDWRAQANNFLSYTSGYDYHFSVCDFEGAYNTLSIAFAKMAWDWIHFVQDKTGREVLLYTSPSLYNQYIFPSQAQYNINWNNVPLWTAQWFFIPNPDGNPTMPKGRTSPWKLWQYTDKGDGTKYGVGRSTACDLDVFHGTPTEMRTWLKIDEPPIPPQPVDIIHSPKYIGVQHISGVRYGWKFESFICDPLQVRYEAVCTPNLETVSSVANRKGAQIAGNGGDWDRIKLYDYAVGSGVICEPSAGVGRPSWMALQDGSLLIDQKPAANVRHALSGARFLIRGGVINPEVYFTNEAKWTEGHARSFHGLTATGKHIWIVSEGVAYNQGLKLWQGAELLKQYGAVVAFDSGGGGDAEIWMDGAVLTATENLDANGNHLERALPQTLLVYADKIGDTMAKNKVTITWDDGAREREFPRVPNATQLTDKTGAILADNSVHYSDFDVVPDSNDQTNVNKRWIKLQSGWYIATRYPPTSGTIYQRALVEAVIPPPTTKPASIEMTLTAGSVIIIKDTTGNVIETLTA